MKIHKNDKVKILSGKDKGKIGAVLKVLPLENKVVVEGINKVKKHIKPGAISKEGGIISIEKPINSSNVIVYDESAKKIVKVGFKVIDGKKYRVNKKTGDILGK